MENPKMAQFRVLVTTPSMVCYEAFVMKPYEHGDLSVFEARTIWKNERRIFRKLGK